MVCKAPNTLKKEDLGTLSIIGSNQFPWGVLTVTLPCLILLFGATLKTDLPEPE